jgi:putative lipoic acid-binding regulatory protein
MGWGQSLKQKSIIIKGQKEHFDHLFPKRYNYKTNSWDCRCSSCWIDNPYIADYVSIDETLIMTKDELKQFIQQQNRYNIKKTPAGVKASTNNRFNHVIAEIDATTTSFEQKQHLIDELKSIDRVKAKSWLKQTGDWDE